MKSLVLLAVLATSPAAEAELPPEVVSFIADRNLCDHFRGEPSDADESDQIARREFIRQSLDIHCAGTDRRLAALKARYSDDKKVLVHLMKYEDAVEPPCR